MRDSGDRACLEPRGCVSGSRTFGPGVGQTSWAIILAQLEDPPDGLAELRGVLMNEHQWRQRTGLDA